MSSVQDRLRVIRERESSAERPRSAAFDRAARAFSNDVAAEDAAVSAPPLASRAARFEAGGDDAPPVARESSLKNRLALFEESPKEQLVEEPPANVLEQASLFERKGDGSAGALGIDAGLPKTKSGPAEVGDRPGLGRGEKSEKVEEVEKAEETDNSITSGAPLDDRPLWARKPEPPPAPSLPSMMTTMSIGLSVGATQIESPEMSTTNSSFADVTSPESSIPASSTASGSFVETSPGHGPGSIAAAASRFGGHVSPATRSSAMPTGRGRNHGAPPQLPKSPSPPQSPALAPAKDARAVGADRHAPYSAAFDRSGSDKHRSEEGTRPVVSPMRKLSLRKAGSEVEEALQGERKPLEGPVFGHGESGEIHAAVKARSALFEQPAEPDYSRAKSKQDEDLFRQRSSMFEERGDESGGGPDGPASGAGPVRNRWPIPGKVVDPPAPRIPGRGDNGLGDASKQDPLPSSRPNSIKLRSSAFENDGDGNCFAADPAGTDPAGTDSTGTDSAGTDSTNEGGSFSSGHASSLRRDRSSQGMFDSSTEETSSVSHAGTWLSSMPATPGSVASVGSMNPSPAIRAAPVFGSPFQQRASMFEKHKEPELPRLSTKALLSKPDGGPVQFHHAASLPVPGSPRRDESSLPSSAKPPTGSPPLRALAARFETTGTGVSSKPVESSSESPFRSTAARFEGASEREPLAKKLASEPIASPRSGFAARAAAFEAQAKGLKSADEPAGGQAGVAGRAAAFEKPASETQAEAKRRAGAEKRSVFDASFLDPSSPTDSLSPTKGGQGSSVFGTMSGHTDARRVVVPKVAGFSASSTDVKSLVRMNGELVTTLLHLKAACAKIEQSKDELKERIRMLEAQVERQNRR